MTHVLKLANGSELRFIEDEDRTNMPFIGTTDINAVDLLFEQWADRQRKQAADVDKAGGPIEGEGIIYG